MTYTTRTVDSRTLSVGDIIIGTPSGIGGRLKAQICERGPMNIDFGDPNRFYAATLEVLEPTSNHRTEDERRGVSHPYYYTHGPVELVVDDQWTTVLPSELAVGDYVRATLRGGQTGASAAIEGTVTGLDISNFAVQIDGTTTSTGMRTYERRAQAWVPADLATLTTGTRVRATMVVNAGDVVTGTLSELDLARDHGLIIRDDGSRRNINPSCRTFEVLGTVPDTHAWTPVHDKTTLAPGDYVRATRSDNLRPPAVGILAHFDLGTDTARITVDDGSDVRINPSSRTFERRSTPSSVEGDVRWTRVQEGEVREGDYIRARLNHASATAPWSHVGEVLRVDQEYLDVRNERGFTTTIDMDFNRVERRDRSVVSITTPAPVQWHPISFMDIRNEDLIRATMPNTGRTVQGTVASRDNRRIVLELANGGRESMSLHRKYEVGNRVPETPVPVQEKYPTIHHLKAALFDITRANYASGEWCGEANGFVRELGIINDMYPETLASVQADEVQPLIDRIRRVAASGRSVSNASIDAAFEVLGIPRTVTPPTRRFQLEIDVPHDLTPEQIRGILESHSSASLVRDPQEVPRG